MCIQPMPTLCRTQLNFICHLPHLSSHKEIFKSFSTGLSIWQQGNNVFRQKTTFPHLPSQIEALKHERHPSSAPYCMKSKRFYWLALMRKCVAFGMRSPICANTCKKTLIHQKCRNFLTVEGNSEIFAAF